MEGSESWVRSRAQPEKPAKVDPESEDEREGDPGIEPPRRGQNGFGHSAAPRRRSNGGPGDRLVRGTQGLHEGDEGGHFGGA